MDPDGWKATEGVPVLRRPPEAKTWLRVLQSGVGDGPSLAASPNGTASPPAMVAAGAEVTMGAVSTPMSIIPDENAPDEKNE